MSRTTDSSIASVVRMPRMHTRPDGRDRRRSHGSHANQSTGGDRDAS